MTQIICIGEPLFELNEQESGLFLPGYGGDTANCAVAAARQGASVAYLTRLGDDLFGRQFMALWAAEGIDTSAVRLHRGEDTGVYFVTHRNDGHHFTYRRANSAASRMTADDLSPEFIGSAQALHVSGISQAISTSARHAISKAITMARTGNTLVSYDTNLRTQLWPLAQARTVIHEAMSHCDIALPSLDDARQLTGLESPDAISDFYLELGPDLVALTMGSNGTLVSTPDQRELIAPFPVDAVDATAAGDTFDGAFLAHYLRSHDPFEAARIANAAAALSTLGYGAVAPMPDWPQTQAFVTERLGIN